MSSTNQMLKRLLKDSKRREKRTAPKVVETVPLTITPSQRDRFTQQNAQILFAIEKQIAEFDRCQSELDDSHVAQALAAGIRGKSPTAPLACELSAQLSKAYELLFGAELSQDQLSYKTNSEVPSDLADWITALRCIYTSVTTRSTCRQRDRSYLNYVVQFIARASR